MQLLARLKTKSIDVLEYGTFPDKGVDRENNIVRGVKILGFDSDNGRRYEPTAVREAVNLYEGAPVNFDHPAKATEPRGYSAKFGQLKNVQFREGQGLYGDLHYNPKHNLSEQFLWDAENNSRNVCLSHNSRCRATWGKDGFKTINRISLVRSVDIVPQGGTTRDLYEHKELPMPKTLRDQLKSLEEHGNQLGDLLEQLGLDLSQEVEVEPTDLEKAKSIVADMFEQPTEKEEEDDPGDVDLTESIQSALQKSLQPLQESIDSLAKREQARSALESAKVPVTTGNIEDLLECKDADAMTNVIESWSGERKGKARPRILARNDNPDATPVKDAKQLAALIRN